MIGYDGAVKLLDFGIAKADHRAHKTQAGVVKGKFAYMAPEQCTAGQSDHRLDIFALGVCLFETITGRSLYRRQDRSRDDARRHHGPGPLAQGASSGCLRRARADPSEGSGQRGGDRFATAEEFANELERFGKSTEQLATQREVADFVKKVFPEEFTRGPRVDTVPFGASITLDMHHANNANDSSSSKSYVSQVPGAIRELEIDGGGAGLDLGHLLDAPIVAPLPTA